jgi:hypothetical protein
MTAEDSSNTGVMMCPQPWTRYPWQHAAKPQSGRMLEEQDKRRREKAKILLTKSKNILVT